MIADWTLDDHDRYCGALSAELKATIPSLANADVAELAIIAGTAMRIIYTVEAARTGANAGEMIERDSIEARKELLVREMADSGELN